MRGSPFLISFVLLFFLFLALAPTSNATEETGYTATNLAALTMPTIHEDTTTTECAICYPSFGEGSQAYAACVAGDVDSGCYAYIKHIQMTARPAGDLTLFLQSCTPSTSEPLSKNTGRSDRLIEH